jgi:hypothetical protein
MRFSVQTGRTTIYTLLSALAVAVSKPERPVADILVDCAVLLVEARAARPMRAKRASGSRPAGCIVEAGLWWWRRTMPVVSGKISAKNWEFESRSAIRWNGPADSGRSRPSFRDDAAHRFRDDLARRSEMMSPTIPG